MMSENQLQAPSSANRMRRWMRNAKLVAIIFGVQALVGVVLLLVGANRTAAHAEGFFAAGIIVTITGAAGVLVGVLTYFNARTLARQMDEMLSGQTLLARWPLTPSEWELFAARESVRARRRARILFPALLIPLAALLCWPFLRGGIQRAGAVVLIPVAVLAFVAFVLWLVLFMPVRHLRAASGDVCVSRDGVLMCGRFTSWHMMGGRLTNVKYEEGAPAVVEFGWMQPGAGNRGSAAPKSVRVPVAAGREDEARRLVASFNT
ncbi:MAG: hypothetical protein QOJ70_274 [Acidobacteriota bacterium]|jgi:hypothetical protein|nr:hypothetical protein [Acidobacteriota bacterium]